jgi:DNA-binding beta-propeller fold protein YncE
MRGSALIGAAAAAAVLAAGCDGGGLTASHTPDPKPARSIAGAAEGGVAGLRSRAMRHHDVYAGTREHDMSAEARRAVPRIYVPNSQSNTVDEIDPHTYRVVRHFATGALPQHVTPSYDMKTLWVDNDLGNTLTPIDPRTGKPGSPVPVEDPYNLYFTPDGRYAMVIAERLRRIDFRDAHTMRMHHSLPVDCFGVDHLDFTADGRFALASCEFSGKMIVVDVKAERVVRQVPLRAGGMPQDVKLAPNGRLFYVADMASGGLWKVDATSFEKKGFLPTGRGAHGLYPSRDSRVLYVANRNEGSISVVSFKTGRVEKKWMLSGGGSPDMGGVSADGRVLWLTGRYNAEVYAIDTRDGHLMKRIPVGAGPHGLSVWPQPGRYSLGHTGVTR